MSRPDPRATMAALPKLLQPFLTWLTGVPLDDEQPLFRWRPATRLASALAVLAAGVGLGLLAVSRGGWMLAALPLAWLLTTHAMRYLNIVVMHFSSHLSFARTEAGNRRVGDAISLLLGLTPWALYRRDHAINHHSKRLATPEDPDVQALAALGFGPGRSRAGSWRLLWRTLGSPMFYLRRVAARLRLNLCTGPWWRRALFVVTQAGLWGAPLALGHGLAWAVAWGVPLLVLYHASDLLQLLSEHLWLRGRGHYLQLTEGRFLGDPWPASGSLTARARWWLRLLAVHLPVRLFVLVGDLPQHDLHHRKPRGEWANATFTRRDAARAAAGSRHPYTDRWGTLAQHIDRVFTLWANSGGPPDGA